MEENISFKLNGKKAKILVDPTETLLWVLRNQLELTGTKFGCGVGFCGACTVLINDEPVRSCTVSVGEIAGKKIVTIEGLAKKGELHPVQKAFVDNDALQCGFCTPGMVLSSKSLLDRQPKPSEEEIKQALSGHLCRCTGYVQILEAVKDAAEKMRQTGPSDQ